MNAPISIVTPVRNGMPYLREAVSAISAQDYPGVELIVVDDGSVDGTAEYVRSIADLPVRWLASSGHGPSAARNTGIRAASSELIAFLDADDLWPPGTLRRLSEALEAAPEAGLAQGLIRNFRDHPDGSREIFTPPYRYLNLGACLWRRGLLTGIGMLDEDLTLCEDLDLLLRCWERDVPKVELDAVTLLYRRHDGNMTKGLSGAGFGTVQAYKKRIERIRAGQYRIGEPRLFSQQDYMGMPPAHQDGVREQHD